MLWFRLINQYFASLPTGSLGTGMRFFSSMIWLGGFAFNLLLYFFNFLYSFWFCDFLINGTLIWIDIVLDCLEFFTW